MEAPRHLEVAEFVNARASEIRALDAALQAEPSVLRGFAALPRALRRRTRSHVPYRHVLRPNAKRKCAEEESQPLPLNRRQRRRRHLLLDKARLSGLPEHVGLRQLETHVWHAKRFKMGTRWGYNLAECIAGKGKGLRSVLRSLKTGVVLHDASYWTVIELQGLEVGIEAVLNSTVSLTPSMPDAAKTGSRAYTVLLHRPSKFPSGAIGPAQVLWQPPLPEPAVSQTRNVWLWVHAAAAAEAYDAIHDAARQLSEVPVTVSRRSGEFVRLELMGGAATELLAAVMNPVATSSVVSVDLHSVQCTDCVVSLNVRDPREALPRSTRMDFLRRKAEHETTISSIVQESAADEYAASSHSTGASPLVDSMDVNTGLLPLWVASPIVQPPPEQEICQRRHAARKPMAQPEADGQSNAAICPALVIPQPPPQRESYCAGWSVILPAGWAMPFWMAFVMTGARPIGLVERRWLAKEVGTRAFPYDYPDTIAYAEYHQEEAQRAAATEDRKPLSKRQRVIDPERSSIT
eukprot:jgi/Chlat1/4053/Chrsp26S04107